MEADEEDLAALDRRSTEGAAPAENGCGKLVVGGLCKVEAEKLAPLGHKGRPAPTGKLEGFVAVEFFLVRQNEIRLLYVQWLQELLGTLAGRSAPAVVVPVDGRHGFAPMFRDTITYLDSQCPTWKQRKQSRANRHQENSAAAKREGQGVP